ncbi:MAG: hypothetical protein ACRD5G_09060, partial [Candidatus Acidiferrales bacterium]
MNLLNPGPSYDPSLIRTPRVTAARCRGTQTSRSVPAKPSILADSAARSKSKAAAIRARYIITLWLLCRLGRECEPVKNEQRVALLDNARPL